MTVMLRCIVLLLLLTFAAAPAFAQKASDPAPLQFRDTTEEQRDENRRHPHEKRQTCTVNQA